MSGAAKRVAVLTSGRQDWGILRSSVAALRARPDTEPIVIAGGMHLAERYGRTVDEIVKDGFEVNLELDWVGAADDLPPAAQAGRALELTAAALADVTPESLVLVGDRLETMAAAVAATLSRVPVVHLHGGEQTLGAFDDAFRHAITKLSHLHLVSHDEHAARLLALGEDPATIHVVGAAGLDNAVRDDLPDRAALESWLGIPLRPPVVIVTVHPATLDPDPAGLVGPVVEAMDAVQATYVVTLPNADPGGHEIRDALVSAVGGRRDRVAVAAMGERRYWGLMRVADAVLGNSSSAIIEAPAVDLPAVDVGDRQLGRRREANVIHVEPDGDAVRDSLRAALDPQFRAAVAAAHPVLADGHVGERVARIIAGWEPPVPPRKSPIQV